MNRARRLLGVLALPLAAIPACGRGAKNPIRRVILITCDTLRADRLGCYGYGRPTSPHLDALAAEGLLFEDAWSTAPLTMPAISSLLAGKTPDEIGVARGNQVIMPSSVITFPEIVRDAGIETAGFVSNFVLRRPPKQFGDAGVSQGFAHFDDELTMPEPNRPFAERSGEATTDAVIRWLEQEPGLAEKRLFLWVHYQDPHGPYTPREPFASEFAAPAPPGEAEIPAGTTQSGKGQIPAYQVIGTDRHPSAYRNRYDAEVRGFDEAVGRLFAWLRDHRLYEDSLIVVTADHGESLGEHDVWFAHGTNLHSEELRVPLLVRGPGVPRGSRRKEPVSILDLGPTVLDAFALPPRPTRGVSLLGSALPAARLVPHSLGKTGEPGRSKAVTGARYRLLLESGAGPELFDRAADPAELRDLSASEPDRVKELVAACEAVFVAGSADSHDLVDPEAKQALRALGYTENSEEH